MSDATIRLGEHEVLQGLHEDAELLAMEATYEPAARPRRRTTTRPRTSTSRCWRAGSASARPTASATSPRARPSTSPRHAHQFWNGGDAPARVRWEVRPALRTRAFFEAIAGSKTPAGKVAAVAKYNKEFRLARL